MTAAEYVIDVLGGASVFKGRTVPTSTELVSTAPLPGTSTKLVERAVGRPRRPVGSESAARKSASAPFASAVFRGVTFGSGFAAALSLFVSSAVRAATGT